MAATIGEHPESRSFTVGNQSVRELKYTIHGTADETEVQTLLLATIPAVYGGLEFDQANVEAVSVDSAAGRGVWNGYARYILIEDDDEYTFDTGGGTQRVTQSLETVASYAPPGFSPPDFLGAIGVSEDRVEGVDITVPQYQFSETHRFATGGVTTEFKLALFALTGTWNASPFKGFAAGECMFLGASGSRRGTGQWYITFRFACSPNLENVTVGDITDISKRGWDYIWVRYADFEDSTAFSLVKRPVAAYVERVSQSGDFSLLGIGT